MPAQSVKTPEEIRKGLRPVRWLRSLAFLCSLVPVLLTAMFVFFHRVVGVDMSFLVGGQPWTHRFWDVLFYTFVAGCFFLLLNRARVCPRCGKGFFQRHGWNPRKKRRGLEKTGARFNVNVFGRQCLNCGLRLDGANADEKFIASESEE